MNKTAKAILSSALSITLCASLIAGSTFALFTNENKTNVAITAGKVDLQATAQITEAYSLDWNGEDDYERVNATVDDNVYTFTNKGTASYADGKLALSNITPGDCVKFTITTTNESSIAIKYRTVVTFVGGGATKEDGEVNTEGKDTSLFHALNITVKDKSDMAVENMENISSDRSTAVSEWSQTVQPRGAIDDIKVSIEFPTESETSLQGQSCMIAIGVYAVQSNGHDESKEDVFLVSADNLNDALNDAADGDTLVLAEDLTLPKDGLQIDDNKEVNVDLFGHAFGVNKDDGTSSEDLVVSEGSTLTVKDSAVGSDNKFTVNTNANSGNDTGDRDYSRYTTEEQKYTMKVEGTLNFEDVDVEVNNKAGDIGICVDGGEINFTEGADLTINGREKNDGYGENGFGKGFYITNGGAVNLNGATVESEGAVTSFIVGGGEEESTLNINGGTYNFKDMYNSITHATFVAAFQTYKNGAININGANLSLTGEAVNQLAYDRVESDTGYTNMVLLSCIGGGNIDVVDSELTISPELGQAFVAQTVCSYYYEESVSGCDHVGKHRGVQNDAEITFRGETRINLDNAAHESTSGAETCFLFAASRKGKQITQYSTDGITYYDDSQQDNTATHAMQLEEDPTTIKVGKDVKIYFSNIEQTKDTRSYSLLADKQTGEAEDGTIHQSYIYDLTDEHISGHATYFESFINRYNKAGIKFDYDVE